MKRALVVGLAGLWIVRAPHFIILGNQEGTYGGPRVTPTTMLVDWLRVTP